MDDRSERPGVKFSECDLIGIPHRLVISPKHLEQHCVEYKARQADEPQLIPLAECMEWLNNSR